MDIGRHAEVMQAVNAYLRAMLKGDPKEMDAALERWEKVADEPERHDVEGGK